MWPRVGRRRECRWTSFWLGIATREGAEFEEAERHARAVFAALGELAPSTEIYDVESELPAEYAPLFSGVV